jgi:hypothetical protein
MTDTNQTEAPHPPAGSGEAQQDVAQAIGAIAEETSTATTGDERSEDDLDALAGGVTSIFAENTTHYT